MIKTMTHHNDNESKQLTFPIQLTPKGPNRTEQQSVQNVMIIFTQRINLANQGYYKLTEEDKRNIRTLNAIFQRNGYPLLDAPF